MSTKVKAILVNMLMHVIALFPRSLSYHLGTFVAFINLRFDTRAARVTATNIKLCYPEMNSVEHDALVKCSLQHTGRTAMETPAAWLGSFSRLRSWIVGVENLVVLQAAQKQKRGVIILLPHIGNWELFNVYYTEFCQGNMVALYQAPEKHYLKNIMGRIRSRFGNELVPANRVGISRLYRSLAAGGVVTILPDQIPQTGRFIEFFGVKALTDQLISRMLRKKRVPVVCVFVKRLEGNCGFKVCFSEPHPAIYSDDLETSMLGVNKTVEACVSTAPEQYQWEYKRFRERPEGELRLYNYAGNQEPRH